MRLFYNILTIVLICIACGNGCYAVVMVESAPQQCAVMAGALLLAVFARMAQAAMEREERKPPKRHDEY